MRGWRRGDAPAGSPFQGLTVRINDAVGYVHERLVRRVYRNRIGDWCADLEVDGQTVVEVFDHHPTTAVMLAIKAHGTEIADDVIDQGAEGLDMRPHARRADDR